jgi:Protein tyrosine and serine/threonine kinase
LLAAREAAVLARLDAGSLYASGSTSAGTWVAVTWCDADPLGKSWHAVRRHDTAENRTAALAVTFRAAQAVADLHARGWRHADLQADHILVGRATPVRLVDLALAQGPAPVHPEVNYRGALAHLTAPEVAAEILTTPATHHVSRTTEAEAYMFGAMLFAAWTGAWPHDYGTDDARSLTVTHVHQRILQPGSLRPMPQGWPLASELLAIMLDPGPADRPTMAAVASMLRVVTGVRR